ncbi:hypothetical protein C8F01DRAFT_462853 [Mycena amicta]|nr:hypothetical protein C8F01DRAFT_462853 [Mycena amicta]
MIMTMEDVSLHPRQRLPGPSFARWTVTLIRYPHLREGQRYRYRQNHPRSTFHFPFHHPALASLWFPPELPIWQSTAFTGTAGHPSHLNLLGFFTLHDYYPPVSRSFVLYLYYCAVGRQCTTKRKKQQQKTDCVVMSCIYRRPICMHRYIHPLPSPPICYAVAANRAFAHSTKSSMADGHAASTSYISKRESMVRIKSRNWG